MREDYLNIANRYRTERKLRYIFITLQFLINLLWYIISTRIYALHEDLILMEEYIEFLEHYKQIEFVFDSISLHLCIGYLIARAAILRSSNRSQYVCDNCGKSLPYAPNLRCCPTCGIEVFDLVPKKQYEPPKYLITVTAARFIRIVMGVLIAIAGFLVLNPFDFAVSPLWSFLQFASVTICIGLYFLVHTLLRKNCVCPHCHGELDFSFKKLFRCPNCGGDIDPYTWSIRRIKE